MRAEVVYRSPTVEEFAAVTAAVGFKARPPEAIRVGLENTGCAVCAVVGGSVVGVGRIVGDGALHFYVTGIMVVPSHQRHGVGSAIVEALLAKVKEIPYANVLVEAVPLPGLESFYARHGFRASRQHAPGMHLWLNGMAANPFIERAHNGGAYLLAPSPPAAPLCAAHVKRWASKAGAVARVAAVEVRSLNTPGVLRQLAPLRELYRANVQHVAPVAKSASGERIPSNQRT
jgi:GNAT superfamily N-acetyltransferase